jgi:hypothetical protein
VSYIFLLDLISMKNIIYEWFKWGTNDDSW